jgi:hypothetical protein
MTFVYGGQVFGDSCGVAPVRNSVVVLVFENDRQITDLKGLRDSDLRVFGDLVNEAARKKSRVSAGTGR